MRAIVGVALVVQSACWLGDRADTIRDVALLAGNVPPMTLLKGVKIGMTAEALKRLRPSATAAAYEGYTETIGPYRVGYSIPGSYSENQIVPSWSPVRSVTIGFRSLDDSLLTREWTKITAQLASTLHSSARCVRDERFVRGKAMLWRQSSKDILVWLSLTQFAIRGKGAPMDSGSFYVLVGDSPFEQLKEKSQPCPAEGVVTQ